MPKTRIKVSQITENIARKFRTHDDAWAVDDYARAYQRGDELPLITVFRGNPGEKEPQYILADGDIRLRAMIHLKREEIEVDVQPGGREEATLFAGGANATNGRIRTQGDKRKAVRNILENPTWWKRSDKWISEVCRVSNHLVKDVRLGMEQEAEEKAAREAEKTKERAAREPDEKDKPEPKESKPEKPKPAVRETRDGKTRPINLSEKKKSSFDWKKFEAALAVVSRGVDDIAAHFNQKDTPEYRGLDALIRQFARDVGVWKRAIIKEE